LVFSPDILDVILRIRIFIITKISPFADILQGDVELLGAGNCRSDITET